MTVKEIEKFIKKVQSAGDFEGTMYTKLAGTLYLVFAWSKDEGLVCKVAENNSSLQCDFDYDWTMPFNEEGDILTANWTDVEKREPKGLAKEVRRSYTYALACMKAEQKKKEAIMEHVNKLKDKAGPMSLTEARKFFTWNILVNLPKKDKLAINYEYDKFLDGLCKNGQITQSQYANHANYYPQVYGKEYGGE